jgi:hypothetical protein
MTTEVEKLIENHAELSPSDWTALSDWILAATADERNAIKNFGGVNLREEWVSMHTKNEETFSTWLIDNCRKVKGSIGSDDLRNLRVVLSGGALINEARADRCKSIFREYLPGSKIIHESFTETM